MLHQIAETFQEKTDIIEEYFSEQARGLVPPLYLSCDIRNSGKKLGVIDTNLFPAGFNNLCNAYSRRASVAFRNYFNKYYPNYRKIIILSEDHTRNRYYLENVYHLKALLEGAGLECRAAFSADKLGTEVLDMPLSLDKNLKMYPLRLEKSQPYAGSMAGDLIISNNDFSQGFPPLIEPILDRVIPSPALGWHRRRKSNHFIILQSLIKDFAARINLDPWLLSCEFTALKLSDYSRTDEMGPFVSGTEGVFQRVQEKYRQYSIADSPYVFIKSDSGTYGMGMLDISDPQDLLKLNRRQRNKLSSSKGGNRNEEFLVQEGIPTADFYSNLPIEPVIYMVGWESIGGFFRMNTERDAVSSLNTRGMVFSCLCLHKLDEPHEEYYLNCAEKENLVALSTVMARLATLASALEIKAIPKAA